MRTVSCLLGLCLLSCASQSAEHYQSVRGLHAQLIALYPFGFRWQEPAYRSFELSQHLVDRALQSSGEHVMFLGPSEFVVMRDDDRAWVSTDILPQLAALHVQPEEAVVARPWAERLVMASQQEMSDAKGRRMGAGNAEQVTYRGHLELLHPSSGTVLAELIADAQVDPFAARDLDDPDPAPALTRLMESLWEKALTALEPSLYRPFAPHPRPFTCWTAPGAVLDFHDGTRPALALELAQKDPLEGDVLRQTRVRYANPGIPDRDAALLSRLPGGLYVREALAGSRLHAGDLIATVDGRPALAETLERARFSRGGASLHVRQANGDWTDVHFP
jgi:hypothetical protein